MDVIVGTLANGQVTFTLRFNNQNVASSLTCVNTTTQNAWGSVTDPTNPANVYASTFAPGTTTVNIPHGWKITVTTTGEGTIISNLPATQTRWPA